MIHKDKEQLRKEIEEFEAGFPDGIYAIPRDPQQPNVRVRALHDYCKATGKTPMELTEEEMERFFERK